MSTNQELPAPDGEALSLGTVERSSVSATENGERFLAIETEWGKFLFGVGGEESAERIGWDAELVAP